ncbi:OmpA family protein [Aliiglaciecola litoralis]|uniref:OmpA-like domain-containing protein n=1 Tax=Aliiglaciecola litoralis TaxID=582857 RepID=A0ABP3X1G9_9ALTE
MADNNKDADHLSDEAQMQQIRDLIVGSDASRIKQVMQDNARELVSDVVIEAIHDRQKQDDAFDHVLVPLVEKSVQKSVKEHSEQFVGYLYPLVGRLVRKSVTAFLAEFLEKTNDLIENSLTLKGLGWRFRAWQSGVSFSQYVASQTFVFRVEQVLLIHRQTGILLNSVSQAGDNSADADLVSSMLTAINDFVSDSFHTTQQDHEQNLKIIKTEDFSLVIKRGPQLLLVAAVTGNISQDISTKFQITIEHIHKLFSKEISQFEGDTLPFEATTQPLKECLLAELKPEAEKRSKKRPILAIILVCIVFMAIGYWGLLSFKQNQLLHQVSEIGEQPGILVHSAKTTGWQNVAISVLRDPSAISVEQWLEERQIDPQRVQFQESGYLSLEPKLVNTRLENTLNRYPRVTLSWHQGKPVLTGTVANAQRQMLARDLFAIPGLSDANELIKGVSVEELATVDDDSPEILRALFEITRAKIDSAQIEFEQGQSSLNEAAKDQLTALASYLKTAIELSKKLELNVGLIIMGASDSSGSKQFNQALSRKRAQAAQQFLVDQGIDAGYLNAIGLGVVELTATGSGARKVIFNIINFKAE